MEPDQLLPVPDYIDDVDTTVPPQSAEHYLAQVIASRRSCPLVVRSEVRRNAPPPASEDSIFDAPASVFVSPAAATRNELAPTEEWVQAKVAAFCANRDLIISHREEVPKRRVEWPAMSDSQEEKWLSMALEECAEEAKDLAERFPDHKGTPPATSVLAAMSTAQIHFLLCALLENWDDEERPSKALLQWVHSLLLFADLPIMPDDRDLVIDGIPYSTVIDDTREDGAPITVCSSLRAFIRSIRTRRVTDTDDATRLQYSSFIAIAAHAFGQKDLAD